MRDKAVALASQGFRVFPLAARSKDPPIVPKNKPPLMNGEYYDTVPSDDPVEVAAMWTGTDGGSLDYNIAIDSSDMLVLDVDNKGDKPGDGALSELVMEYELDLNTLETRTPTGGRHLFYRLPDGVRVANSASKLAPGIDVRGYHGYVVAPGSVLPNGEYRWARSPDATAMASAPDGILCRLGEARQGTSKEQILAIEGLELDQPAAIERARLWLVNDAPEAIENNAGNNTTFKVAATVKDFAISEPMCLELLAEYWNPEKAAPPWTMDELETLVRNAYKHGKEPIGANAPEAQFPAVELEGTLSSGEMSQERKVRFPLVPYKQLRSSPEVNYLVKGFLPREGVGVLWGPPKCGKSFSWYDIAMHVAMGREYRGRRVTQGTVVYCAFEGAAGYGARTEAFRRQYEIAPETEVPLYLMPARTNLIKDHPQLIVAIRNQLMGGASSLAMVVLDTLNRSFVGSESKDEDMTAYYLAADAIREAFGCFVQIIHHCGLDGSRPRGHSSLTGAVAVQHAQSRKGNDLIIEVEFMRDGPEGAKVESRLVTLEIGKDVEGDPITSCVTIPRTGFEEMKIELTPIETEWFEKLDAWARDRREEMKLARLSDVRITVEVVREVIFTSKGGGNDGASFDKKGTARTTIRERLTEMTEKGALKKGERGEWFIPE